MTDTETLLCVGGPFDGQMVTTPLWSEILVKDSLPDLDSGASVVRSTYVRDPPGSETDVWRFKSSSTIGLD